MSISFSAEDRELVRLILNELILGISAAAGGDVDGPASAVLNDVALFADTSGKVIKSGGQLGTAAFQAVAAFATAAQGILASTAVQPAGLVGSAVSLIPPPGTGNLPVTVNDVQDLLDEVDALLLGGAATVDFVSNVATATILGRTTAGSGNSEELSDVQVRTLLGLGTAALSAVGDFAAAAHTHAGVYDPAGTAAAAAAAAQSYAIQRGNHTGSQVGSTISDLEAYVGGGPLFVPNAGSYLSPLSCFGGLSSTLSGTLNLIYYVPLLVPRAFTADRIGLVVAGAAAGKSVRVGIYSSSAAGRPDALIADCGLISLTATGGQEITISQAIPRGLVWLAMLGEVNPSVGGADFSVRAGLISLTATSSTSGFSEAQTFGALPATATPSAHTTRQPDIRLRVG